MRPPGALRRRIGAARRHTAFLLAGVPVQLAAFFCALLVVPTPMLTAVQRNRFRTMLGTDIPRPEAAPQACGWRGLPAWLRSAACWRQMGYHLVVGPLMAFGAFVVLALWLVGGVAGSVLLWIWLVPAAWRINHRGYTTQALYLTCAGGVLLCAAVWLSGVLTRADRHLAIVLLGPSRTERLWRRIEDLAESRTGVLDAADLERRRIERDLHDGAQQRLVSMAVNLGIAKATLRDLPEDALKVIDEAHREAKEAIAELSNLVRGLHPAVLEDRGLDAAVSGIAARVPVPVKLTVDLPIRPSPIIEAVAYFVVSEALTNVVKHARATQVVVSIRQVGGVLHVVVSDDGVGGAESSRGTGMSGLAKRVASVDGRMSISSPVGGPTIVAVELPCAP